MKSKSIQAIIIPVKYAVYVLILQMSFVNTLHAGPRTMDKIVGSEFLIQEQIEISGMVTDEEGQPLPGATIQIKGSSQGVLTDFDGNYDFRYPQCNR